jgi:hypothetical protein
MAFLGRKEDGRARAIGAPNGRRAGANTGVRLCAESRRLNRAA